MRLSLAAALLASFLVSPAMAADFTIEPPVPPKMEILTLRGSSLVDAALMQPHLAALTKETGLTLEITANAQEQGLVDLQQGRGEVAMLNAKLEDVAKTINAVKEGYIKPADYKSFDIGKTRLALVTNPDNKVKSLSAAQLKDILSGKIKSWKEVGGEDTPINLILEMPTTGTRKVFEKTYAGDKGIEAANKREVPATLVAQLAAQSPGSLGLTLSAYLSKDVAEIKLEGAEEFPLILATKGAPSPKAEKLIGAVKKLAK